MNIAVKEMGNLCCKKLVSPDRPEAYEMNDIQQRILDNTLQRKAKYEFRNVVGVVGNETSGSAQLRETYKTKPDIYVHVTGDDISKKRVNGGRISSSSESRSNLIQLNEAASNKNDGSAQLRETDKTKPDKYVPVTGDDISKKQGNGRRISSSSENRSNLTQLNEAGINTILTNFRYLKDNLDVDSELLDYFIQEDIFNTDQVDSIKAESTRRQKVDYLLRMLMRSKENAYRMFLEFLTKTNNEHIRNNLEKETGETDIDCSNIAPKTAIHSLKLNKETIIKELQPEIVMDHFVQYRQFTIDEYEEVISERTRKKQAVRFMKILTKDKHVPRGYAVFLKALKENEEIYLYQLLESQIENEPIVSNYEIVPVMVDTLTDEETLSEDDTDVLITIRIKKKNEKKIIETITNADIGQAICDRLLSDTDCLLYSATHGSIIIRIKGCRKGSIKNLLEKGYNVGVSKILGIILSHPAVMKYADREMIDTLTVEILHTTEAKKIEENIYFKQLIRNNLAYLTEELDPIRYMDLSIFVEEEKDKITKLRSKSRADGTKYMLELALTKTEEQLKDLMEEIKRRKEYVWGHMVKQGNKEDLRDVLTSNYSHLVDNLCPSMIVVHCAENDLLNYGVYKQFKEKPRSWITKFVLQEIMRKNEVEINTFLRVLSTFQPNAMLVIKNGMTEPIKVKEKDKDNKSGYRSLSLKRRINRYNGKSSADGLPLSQTRDDNGYSSLPQTTTMLSDSSPPDQHGMTELGN